MWLAYGCKGIYTRSDLLLIVDNKENNMRIECPKCHIVEELKNVSIICQMVYKDTMIGVPNDTPHLMFTFVCKCGMKMDAWFKMDDYRSEFKEILDERN